MSSSSSSALTLNVVRLLSCLLLSLSTSVVAFPVEFPGKLPVGFPQRKGLERGYYQWRCPAAENVIRNLVNKAVSRNPGIAAGLIRLHFHDCFVRGCDASVLLDVGPGGAPSEKEGLPNKGTLRGFEVIDAAKAQLEKLCPRTVSCADILAFAARDSAYKVGKIWWDVLAGRKDGRISLANETLSNLPSPFTDVNGLMNNFRTKGMSLDEMVVLSGAHSIGIAHCPVFQQRLYPNPDSTMDPSYVASLRNICPPTSTNSTGAPPSAVLDPLTPNRLDNKYYVDLKNRRGLLASDQVLVNDQRTAKSVLTYAKYGSLWSRKFAAAMVHMGFLDVLTDDQGEIRNNCHFVN